MNQPQPTNVGVWVRLWLVPQTEGSTMPASIVGYLTEDNPSSYVLTKVIDYVQDEDTFETERKIVDQINIVNRTYVWNCEILGAEPFTEEEPYNGEGGLG